MWQSPDIKLLNNTCSTVPSANFSPGFASLFLLLSLFKSPARSDRPVETSPKTPRIRLEKPRKIFPIHALFGAEVAVENAGGDCKAWVFLKLFPAAGGEIIEGDGNEEKLVDLLGNIRKAT